MKYLLKVIGLMGVSLFKAQDWKTDDQYIQNFAAYAVEEMEKYKIPASITLAQGLLETGGGQSRLAQEGKNHFGIKCKEDWVGKTMKHTDDAPNECFRVYDDPKQSYRDHSVFLATRKYYTPLFSLNMKDYKAWSYGLKKAGYATNPKYAQILISKIEKYHLDEFDNANSQTVYAKLMTIYPQLRTDPQFLAKIGVKQTETAIVKPPKTLDEVRVSAPVVLTIAQHLAKINLKSHPNGGLKYVEIPVKMPLSLIAEKYQISESRLMRFNDLESDMLPSNSVLFLEKKEKNALKPFYKVENGDTMQGISQKLAIRLAKLLRKNRMSLRDVIHPNDTLYTIDKKPR